MPVDENTETLASWYLAKLRANAFDAPPADLTPITLVQTDKILIRQILDNSAARQSQLEQELKRMFQGQLEQLKLLRNLLIGSLVLGIVFLSVCLFK